MMLSETELSICNKLHLCNPTKNLDYSGKTYYPKKASTVCDENYLQSKDTKRL